MEVFPSIDDLRTWADRLEEVQDRLAPYFERAEPRQRVMAYLRGLLSITERKNSWQLAELAGEATPDGMQRLLNHALRLGVLKRGDQLPTVKEVVDKLLLSPNTVLKAYRELELEGLISSRQGVGTFVLRTLVDPLLTRHAALLRRLVRWMHDAQQAGLGEEDIDALIANARQAVFPQEEIS